MAKIVGAAVQAAAEGLVEHLTPLLKISQEDVEKVGALTSAAASCVQSGHCAPGGVAGTRPHEEVAHAEAI